MISRRAFVGTSALAATSAVVGAPYELLAADEIDAHTPQNVPPSIARLRSQADRATPISVGEREGRVEKAKRLMHEQGLDALMLMGGTSMVYFTNIRWGLSERLFSVVIPVRGDAFVVTPSFEESRTREQLAQSPLTNADVLTWQEHEDPYQRVAEGLRARGISGGKLAVEETVRFMFADGVAHAAPTLEVVSGTPVTAGCRGKKDAHELELMRLASEVTLTAYKAAYAALDEGMTQNDFAGLVRLAHNRLGFSGGAGVQVGEFSALPHGSITVQVVREGTILLIDGGCSVEGYRSDLSRTFVLGRATDKMKRVYDIEYRAQAAALDQARPGVAAETVDAAARKVIEDGGYGPGYRYFTHRVGHGMGMDGHEWPYLVQGNTMLLEPGMTFSDEPGIYIPGEFGVRLEDDMVITEDGAELFTPQSPSLEDPFGNWPL